MDLVSLTEDAHEYRGNFCKYRAAVGGPGRAV